MESRKWLYYTPSFESDNYNLEMMKYAPWSGHRLFAYDYVCNIKPEVIVELGSHYGCSAFTFQQAIKDMDLKTQFYAIDTWAGDKYTENDYVENIFEEYKRVQNTCFSKQNNKMMRMTFDEAAEHFEDNSIDLLHIDGSHIYEDVKHDFKVWKNKVKKEGVIFFHDIAEDVVLGEKMGSYFLWNEIKKDYHFYVEFMFSYGLGIIFFDKHKWKLFNKKVDFGYYQKCENCAVNENKDFIRRNFFEIREQNKHIHSLYKQINIQREHLDKYERSTEQKNDYIEKLEKTIQGKDGYIAELEHNITELNKFIQMKEQYIEELTDKIDSLKKDEFDRDFVLSN